MRRIAFALLVITINCFSQSQEPTRSERVRAYYENLALFNSSVKQMQALGINPFQPDYSQEGGGLSFQTFTKLQANLRSEANALGLNDEIADPLDSYSTIKDGWYHATVKYSNSNTYTRSTYTLDVEVESDRVVAIDFGNGGSVHSGYNNSGYYYTGGDLTFQYDYDRNIVGATTRVTVQRSSTYLTYDVEIN